MYCVSFIQYSFSFRVLSVLFVGHWLFSLLLQIPQVWHFIHSKNPPFLDNPLTWWSKDIVRKKACRIWNMNQKRTILGDLFVVKPSDCLWGSGIGGDLTECWLSRTHFLIVILLQLFKSRSLLVEVRAWDIPWEYMWNALLWRIGFGTLKWIMEAAISFLRLWSKMAVIFGLPQNCLKFCLLWLTLIGNSYGRVGRE